MFNCRTRLFRFLCLKYCGRMLLQNAYGSIMWKLRPVCKILMRIFLILKGKPRPIEPLLGKQDPPQCSKVWLEKVEFSARHPPSTKTATYKSSVYMGIGLEWVLMIVSLMMFRLVSNNSFTNFDCCWKIYKCIDF